MKKELLNTLQIDTITAEILKLQQQTVQNLIEIGKRLITVKKSLPHGEWGKYLEEKVKFKKSTANNLMRVAKKFSNFQAIGDLGQTKIFALLDIKSDKKEEFIKEKHNVNGKEKTVQEMTTRELKEAIKQHNDLEEKLKNNEQNIKKIKEDILINTDTDSDISVKFEENKTDYGTLSYNIYFVKCGAEQLVVSDYIATWFEDIDVTSSSEIVVKAVSRCETLLQTERDYILGECLKFKETALKRDKEYDDERSNAFKKTISDLLNIKESPNIAILKKFYRTLAMTYHPDKGGTVEEMQVLNQLKQQWGI